MRCFKFLIQAFFITLLFVFSAKSLLAQDKKSLAIDVTALPEIKEMPDPLTMNNGKKVTTLKQWRIRRQEMISTLEDYEYGHMPPPPGNVRATVVTPDSLVFADKDSTFKAHYRKLHLTFGPNQACGFDLAVFTPLQKAPVGGYPVVVSLSFSAGSRSILFAAEALKRGYAVVTVPYRELGADAKNWKETAFFPHYPQYDWRDFSAWAWGISRAVDYLETDSSIDKNKIIITGVSRNAQAVMLAGALDERIALTAPIAGGMALRFSGKEMANGLGQGITEVVDQNTYWFGPNLEKFRNQTTKLPCDQHWLPALTAPRLFIMCNAYSDQYGRAYAALQTFLGAQPVYKLLGANDNLGMHFREGKHGMNIEDWSALLDFADQKLLGKPGKRIFNAIPPAEKTP